MSDDVTVTINWRDARKAFVRSGVGFTSKEEHAFKHWMGFPGADLLIAGIQEIPDGGPTCKGCFALGSACGRCEKCRNELSGRRSATGDL